MAVEVVTLRVGDDAPGDGPISAAWGMILQSLLLYRRLKAVFSRCEDVLKEHGLQGPGLPCTGCVSHTGYLEHGNSKGEAR